MLRVYASIRLNFKFKCSGRDIVRSRAHIATDAHTSERASVRWMVQLMEADTA
jgi:hypothetical protein